MANQTGSGLDPVYESERGRGSTPPERGPDETSVVGRPAVERPKTAFHEPAETKGEEREPATVDEAETEGGSFDAIAPTNPEPPA